MALIKCPECSREVSSQAVSCPQCGCPIATLPPQNQNAPSPKAKETLVKESIPFALNIPDADTNELTYGDLKLRRAFPFWFLTVITLGFYEFYLVPKLSVSVNYLIGNNKYKAKRVFWINLLSLGLAAGVYAVLFTLQLKKHPDYTRNKWDNHNIESITLICAIGSFAFFLFSATSLIVLSWVLEIIALWIVQKEINQYIELGNDVSAGNSVSNQSPEYIK